MKRLLTNIFSLVKWSAWVLFFMFLGSRHGDPLSLLLFSLVDVDILCRLMSVGVDRGLTNGISFGFCCFCNVLMILYLKFLVM